MYSFAHFLLLLMTGLAAICCTWKDYCSYTEPYRSGRCFRYLCINSRNTLQVTSFTCLGADRYKSLSLSFSTHSLTHHQPYTDTLNWHSLKPTSSSWVMFQLIVLFLCCLLFRWDICLKYTQDTLVIKEIFSVAFTSFTCKQWQCLLVHTPLLHYPQPQGLYTERLCWACWNNFVKLFP